MSSSESFFVLFFVLFFSVPASAVRRLHFKRLFFFCFFCERLIALSKKSPSFFNRIRRFLMVLFLTHFPVTPPPYSKKPPPLLGDC